MNTPENVTRKEGFAFAFNPAACADCSGRCCRGQTGAVYIGGQELDKIAAFLQQNIVDCINTFLERRENRLVIREKHTEKESICFFFDTSQNRCLIYEVRPVQCRSFPFWNYFRKDPALAEAECPGILPGE